MLAVFEVGTGGAVEGGGSADAAGEAWDAVVVELDEADRLPLVEFRRGELDTGSYSACPRGRGC